MAAHGSHAKSQPMPDMKTMPEMSGMSESEMKAMPTTNDAAMQNESKAAPAAAPHDMNAMSGAMDGMKMGGDVPASSKFIVTLITLLMLAAGVWLAGSYGDFSMRAAGDRMQMPMNGNQMNEMKR
jgi:hypothetical protein